MLQEDLFGTESFIHSMDPRVKVAVCGAFSIIVALSRRWEALTVAVLMALILFAVSRLSFKRVAVRLAVINGLILFLWAILPFAIKGTPVFRLGPLEMSKEGLIYCAEITVRSNAIILVIMSMLSTTPIFTLARAMGQLGMPEKIVQLLLFTYRYLHVIHLEYKKLLNALKIRGFVPKTNLHTYRTYAYLVGMLLVRSYDRAERIRRAMLCRGFNGRYYDLTEFSLKNTDVLAGGLMIIGIVIIGLLQWIIIN